MGSRDAREVRIGSRQLRLVNLDKVLYPQARFTKAQVIDYYVRISGALLPHLRDRPLTLKRYPNGVTHPYFYEKRCEVGLLLRGLFDSLRLACYAKTSGSKGLQVYVPLNTPGVSYEDTKPFARAVAELLERERPERIVSNMKKSLRTGKVLVDWSQNDPHKTTVCVYSLRAKERPTASTPVTWEA